jgi:outer membrane protein OmpA-like peptidoglycan-associated protein
MQKRLFGFFGCALVVSFMLAAPQPGVARDHQTKVEGVIADHSGEVLTLRTANGDKTVTLSESTKVKGHEGAAALVPGLRIVIKGHDNEQGQMVADSIKFREADLNTAHEIQAGLTPTEQKLEATGKKVDANTQQIAANQQQVEQQIQDGRQLIQANQNEIQSTQKQVQGVQADAMTLTKRLGELSDYDVKAETKVYFKTNSAHLTDEAKSELKALADNVAHSHNYLIQVAGYADATGNSAWNEQLSNRRAEAVVEYLRQECNVPLSRVLAPAGMGTSQPAASNDTADGRKENRRVEVKILVNRGVGEEAPAVAALPQ